MSEDEQRISIAKACGWKQVSVYDWKDGIRVPKQWHRDMNGTIHNLPDYLHDLNACHDMLKGLNKEQAQLFVVRLFSLVAHDSFERLNNERDLTFSPWMTWHLINATAWQYCEAFLRTLRLWKE